MSLLAGLTSDNTIATEKDSIGSSYGPRDSALYPMTVQYAYITTAASGALGLVLSLKDDAGEVRATEWMSSGKEKGFKNYFEKDGKKTYLPGFLNANALCLLTVGKEISQLDTEKKVIPLYSAEAKKEVPTQVDMVTDLLGKEILVGLIRQTVDKTAKNDAGQYVATGETRDENVIDKFFRLSDKKTTAEIRAQAEEANFFSLWDQKWTGKTRMKAKGAQAGGAKAGAPAQAAAGGARQPSSLFG